MDKNLLLYKRYITGQDELVCPCTYTTRAKFNMQRHILTCKTIKSREAEYVTDTPAIEELQARLATEQALRGAAEKKIGELQTKIDQQQAEIAALKKGVVPDPNELDAVLKEPEGVRISQKNPDYPLPTQEQVVPLLNNPKTALFHYLKLKYDCSNIEIAGTTMRVVKQFPAENKWAEVDKHKTIKDLVDWADEDLQTLQRYNKFLDNMTDPYDKYLAKVQKEFGAWLSKCKKRKL